MFMGVWEKAAAGNLYGTFTNITKHALHVGYFY